jgi:hypothetical protein
MVGYCALIALGLSQRWSWLQWWFDLWMPVVDVFRPLIPIFDHFERVLAAKGSLNRLAAIDHLLAVGWLVSPPIFAFVTFTVVRLSRAEWVRFTTGFGNWCGLGLLVMTLFFLFALTWIVFGFGLESENPMYGMHRYNGALLGIGIYFSGATLSGVGTVISIGALIVGQQLKRKKGNGSATTTN